MSANVRDERFHAYFDSDEELPDLRPFPQVASQILSACDDPDTTPKELAQVIQCDPAVSTRLLQLANSSMYGFAGEICTINQAIVAIGFRSLKSIAVSLATSDVFKTDSVETAEASNQLLLHSLATGTIASMVARFAPVSPEEAFLAGVVHDVGKLVFLDIASSEYIESMSSSTSSDRTQVETELYGISHQEIGERCADEWGLPAEVNSAIANHHDPENAIDREDVAGVVCVANGLARLWKCGGPEGTSTELDEALERSCIDESAAAFEGEFMEEALEKFSAIRSAYV